jgi:hypothetical protein
MKSYIVAILLILSGTLYSQPEETEQQKSMAKQMAKFMDQAWEAKPEAGQANLRLLFLKNGEPYAGATSIHGRFDFILQGKRNYSTSVNPNDKGRYVYENIEPGTYKLILTGKHEMEGFSYEESNLQIEGNERPVIEISLP